MSNNFLGTSMTGVALSPLGVKRRAVKKERRG